MRDKINARLYIILAWILTGILVICSSYFTYYNDFREISFSLDNNYVAEISHWVFKSPQTEVEDGIVSYKFKCYLNEGEVNYLRVYADGIGDGKAKLVFTGMSRRGRTRYETDPVKIHDGCNDIPLKKQNYSLAQITVKGPDEKVVKAAEFRQSVTPHPVINALGFMLLVTIGYVLLTALIVVIYKLLKQVSESRSKRLVISTGSFKYVLPLPASVATWVRTILWFALITSTLVVQINDYYDDYFNTFLNVELGIILALAIMLNDADHQSKRTRIDLSMFFTLALYTIWTIVSDNNVMKPTGFAAVKIFVILAIFAYIWAGKQDHELFLQEFERAVQLFLVLLIVLSFTMNKDIEDARYSGPISNPSIYALYLASIWAVLMASLEGQLRFRRFSPKIVLTGIELAVTLYLIVAAQSMTPMLAVIFVLGLFIFRKAIEKIGIRKALRILAGIMVLFFAVGFAIIINPDLLNRFSGRLAQKLGSADITQFLSGRDYYYRCYMNKMNLFGHDAKPYCLYANSHIKPHNSLIGQAYTYGVPVIVPFILLMVRAVDKSVKFARENLVFSALPLYCISSFILMSMADNVDRFFVWLPWISCYMMFVPIMFYRSDGDKLKKSRDQIIEEQ